MSFHCPPASQAAAAPPPRNRNCVRMEDRRRSCGGEGIADGARPIRGLPANPRPAVLRPGGTRRDCR
jgi:hypothetical protein